MSDIGEAIKYLYEKFILRDLLSFVTPGAIVIGSILFLRWDFCQILEYSKSIPFVLLIPILGILFVVGFAIQCFGADIVHIIQFHSCKNDREHFERLSRFYQNKDDKSEQQHERFVVLKQMSGNCFLAILIAGALFAAKQCIPPFYNTLLGILILLMVISLFWGHRVHVKRQKEWEDIQIG